MTVSVQTEKRPALSEEARRRLGRVYAFLLSLPDVKGASDGDRAGEPDPSEAGSVVTQEGDNARAL